MANEKKIDLIKNSKPFKIADIVVFVVLIALAVTLMLTVYSKKGDKIQISYNGTTSSYPLSVDKEINLDNVLTVVIKNNECYVVDAKCPDARWHSNAISKVNQTIVCAPYGILIRVVSNTDSGNRIN